MYNVIVKLPSYADYQQMLDLASEHRATSRIGKTFGQVLADATQALAALIVRPVHA